LKTCKKSKFVLNLFLLTWLFFSDSNPEANLLPPSLFNNVQPQVGISHSSGFKVTPLDFHSAAVRSIIERKKRQTFPNFSQLSGSSQNIGNPQFPNTQSQVQSSSVDFPDIMSQPFRIPSSIQQQFDRKKRQTLL